jgi:hypothetical protein
VSINASQRRALRDHALWPEPPAWLAALNEPSRIVWEYGYLEAELALVPLFVPIVGPDGKVRDGCDRPDCTAVGKHPCIKWAGVDSPTDLADVEYWVRRWGHGRRVNLGVVMGACNPEICGLDCDPRNGGDETLAALLEKHGPLPETWADETNGGGGHLFFLRPDDLPDTSCVALGNGLEFLQGRHLAIIAPSIHRSGHVYRWRNKPWEAPLSPLPTWLADMVRAKEEAKRKAGTSVYFNAATSWTPPVDLDRRHLMRRARAYVDRMPSAISGAGGDLATFSVACRLVVDFALHEWEAWQILSEFNQRCQPPWSDKALRRKLARAQQQPGPRGRLAEKGLAGTDGQPTASWAELRAMGLVPDEHGRFATDLTDPNDDGLVWCDA